MLVPVVDRFVADVAERFLALSAVDHVKCPFFLVDCFAPGAEHAELGVHERALFEAHALLNQVSCDLMRLKMRFVVAALRVLLEVLLSLRRVKAHPAEVVVADWALHVRATGLDLLYHGTALRVRAPFATVLEKQIHKVGGRLLVVLRDLLYLRAGFRIGLHNQIDSV